MIPPSAQESREPLVLQQSEEGFVGLDVGVNDVGRIKQEVHGPKRIADDVLNQAEAPRFLIDPLLHVRHVACGGVEHETLLMHLSIQPFSLEMI